MATSISVRRHGPLILRIAEDRDSLVLRATGELDMAAAPMVEQSLLHALEGGASSIVLDLTAVSFIDAAGLRVLLWAAGSSREEGDRLRIDCGSPVVRRLVDLTRSGRGTPAGGSPGPRA